MRGSLCFVGLILLFTTLMGGSAFRHSARKHLKNSLNPDLRKTNFKTQKGEYRIYVKNEK